MERVCTADYCERPIQARAWCYMHYKRWRVTGDPNSPGKFDPPDVRFWRKVDASGDCWEWLAERSHAGYGRFSLSKFNRVPAHRWAYEALVGPIPDDLTIDHLCNNPPCVNPDHMALATIRANILRGYGPPARNARKTHCKHGHPFFGDNLYVTPQGGRVCRACVRSTKRRWRERQKESV